MKYGIYVINVCKYDGYAALKVVAAFLSQLAARHLSSGCILDRMLCRTIAANTGDTGYPCANPS